MTTHNASTEKLVCPKCGSEDSIPSFIYALHIGLASSLFFLTGIPLPIIKKGKKKMKCSRCVNKFYADHDARVI